MSIVYNVRYRLAFWWVCHGLLSVYKHILSPAHYGYSNNSDFNCNLKESKVLVEEWKTNLISLAILFHFLRAQHVSDINVSNIRSLRPRCWITTSVVLFSVRCVLEIWCGWFWVVLVLQVEAQFVLQPAKRTENKTTDVVIQQHNRKLLMMDILMSETCWAHKKWNKIASGIKLVFRSSTITMMDGPINIRFTNFIVTYVVMSPQHLSIIFA